MKIVLARNTEKDFQGYLKLEEEYDNHYQSLKIGEQYERVPFKDQLLSNHRKEFEKCFILDSFMMFAKQKEEYVGYVIGYIEEMPHTYKIRKVGCSDGIIVSEKYRGLGVGEKLHKARIQWFKKRGIIMHQLTVKSKNVNSYEKFLKWGFQVDELRLWMKI